MQRTLQPLRPTGARAPRAAASAAPRASPRAAARAAPAPGPGPGPGARAAAPAPRGGAAASWQRRSSALAAPSPFPSSPAPSPPASVAELNAGQRAARLAHLEATALAALSEALSHRFRSPVFTCALIAGDVVLLHLLHRLGALAPAGAAGEEPRRGRAAVVFVDTLHLFPETYAFLARCEAAFGFTALRFKPAGFASRGALDAALGPELWRQDEPRYDRVCKVEPFARALAELDADVMVNGRRRDHGFERAQLEPWEGPTPGGGGPTKCQPLAYWEFRDCFDYLAKHGVEAHPLHGQGYPSVGDVHSTVPVPRERWFDYAGERSGRFQGMTGKDGSSPKTECGIHVDGAARAFERDLWVAGGVEALTPDDYAQHGASAGGGAAGGEDVLLVVYAPWCPFCQAMEAQLQRLADAAPRLAGPRRLRLRKLRGDTARDFVRASLATQAFPTILAFPAAGGGRAFVKHASEERSAEALLAFVNGACATARSLSAQQAGEGSWEL